MSLRSHVSVVDDDQSVRESLPGLLEAFGHDVHVFASAEEFLASGAIGQTKCLILDIAMHGMSGPELQLELKRRGQEVPIVFITAHPDASFRLRMLQHGAIECLSKPFSEADLLAALDTALGAA